MKCKIYVEDVHTLTVDEGDVDSMLKWLKDTGATNVLVRDSSVMGAKTSSGRTTWVERSWHEEDDNGVSNADRYMDELDYQ
tara:strand:- start:178 stop:420 length:243 start_codon:yes stop_codon:yes gene_type:complete